MRPRVRLIGVLPTVATLRSRGQSSTQPIDLIDDGTTDPVYGIRAGRGYVARYKWSTIQQYTDGGEARRPLLLDAGAGVVWTDPDNAALAAQELLQQRGWLARGRPNIGIQAGTLGYQPKAAPWPGPSVADDDYCPIHRERYRDFRPGTSYEDAQLAVERNLGIERDYYGRTDQAVPESLVMQERRAMKLTAWRDRHGWCGVELEDEDPDADPFDDFVPDEWHAEHRGRTLICFDTPRQPPGHVCFFGTQGERAGAAAPRPTFGQRLLRAAGRVPRPPRFGRKR